jgi:hypothetical protein
MATGLVQRVLENNYIELEHILYYHINHFW